MKPPKGSQAPVDEEQVAMVMFYIGKGKKATEIADLLKIGRQVHYKLLRVAAEKHRLQYVAPPELRAGFRIRSEYTWLNHVRVANTAVSADVSYHTAQLV